MKGIDVAGYVIGRNKINSQFINAMQESAGRE